jgi:CTP:molybdopterin cytidylyltransferase MocA
MTTAIVDACIREYLARPGCIVAATTSNRPRHPVIVPYELRGALERLRGVGLQGIFAAHADQLHLVRIDGEEGLRDMDTPEDYWRAT